jgi:hypothetical protein
VDGHPPFGDFYDLKELARIADEWGPIVYAHEPTAHGQFPELFGARFTRYGEMLPTCEYGIARRADHASLLRRTWELGISKLRRYPG